MKEKSGEWRKKWTATNVIHGNEEATEEVNLKTYEDRKKF